MAGCALAVAALPAIMPSPDASGEVRAETPSDGSEVPAPPEEQGELYRPPWSQEAWRLWNAGAWNVGVSSIAGKSVKLHVEVPNVLAGVPFELLEEFAHVSACFDDLLVQVPRGDPVNEPVHPVRMSRHQAPLHPSKPCPSKRCKASEPASVV